MSPKLSMTAQKISHAISATGLGAEAVAGGTGEDMMAGIRRPDARGMF
jgi:hypothetical protein